MTTVDEQIRALLLGILYRVPRFRGIADDALEFKRLGGATNQNFRVTHGGESFVLRVAGAGTNELTDRTTEWAHLNLAAAWRFAPAVLWHDADTGALLSRYISNARTLNVDDVRRPQIRQQMTRMLARLHRMPLRFAFTLDPFATITRYLKAAAGYGELAVEYNELIGRHQKLGKAVDNATDRTPASIVPCHIDANPGNFIDDGTRLWLVDWEYAAHSHPLWDLACLCEEAGLNDDEADAVLNSYPGKAPGSVPDLDRWRATFSLTRLAWLAAQVAANNHRDRHWPALRHELASVRVSN
jgi:thiamine kinase-like enzyme